MAIFYLRALEFWQTARRPIRDWDVETRYVSALYPLLPTYLPTDDDDDDGPRHVVTLAVAKLVVEGGKQ